MKSIAPIAPIGLGAQLSVAAIVFLGMLGGALIVAHSGFATSPRRGGHSIFVPAPEAYVLAATMFGMSALGMLALLQHRGASVGAMGAALVGYGAVAACLTVVLAP